MLRIKTVSLDMFFDTERVKKVADTATRKVLSKAGAFIRTAAKSSIRKRKAISAPGQPPSSHTGLLKRFIFFGYDKHWRSVVIGPTRLNQATGVAPPALEYGGPSRVTSGGRRKKKGVRKVTIRARPFMQPAFEKEQKKLPSLWANSIR